MWTRRQRELTPLGKGTQARSSAEGEGNESQVEGRVHAAQGVQRQRDIEKGVKFSGPPVGSLC